MKYCPNCGCGNEDFSSLCSNCGATLISITSSTQKKRNTGNKKLLKISAAFAAACVLVGGVFAGVKLVGGNSLSRAYQRTTKAIAEEANEQKGISAVTSMLEKYENQGKYTLTIGYHNSALALDLSCDYSRNSKLMDGELLYTDAQTSVGVNYAVKKDVIQFTIPGVMQDVYGFSVDKMGKKLDTSAVSKLLPFDFSALRDLDFFQKTNAAKSLNKLTKGKLNVLKDSVKIQYLDKRILSLAGKDQTCKMYQVTWNEQTVNALLESLSTNPILSKLVGFVRELIPKIDGDCRCYISKDGYLVGVDLVSLGSKYLFVMEGEENPWDKFSLTVTSLTGEVTEYTGGLFNTDSGMQLYLKNQDEIFLGLDYSSDGKFSVYTDKYGTIVYGTAIASGDQISLEINLNSAAAGTQQLICTVSALEEKPKQLAKYYVDLLDMDLADWQRLLLDLGITASLS